MGDHQARGEKHVAFSVSGGCFFYQMGIAYFIQKHFDTAGVKFSGASGGCWPATLLAADIDVKEALEVVLEFAPQCVESRSWKALGAYGVYDKGIAIAFHELCRRGSNHNLPVKVNGRLAISVTRLAWSELGLGVSRPYFKDEVVSEFTSNEDIVECIVASALIPFALNGKPYVTYRDWICADGGITNVSGVRRFAAELAHDIERIEEGLDVLLEEGLEQAHRLSQSYKAKLPPVFSGGALSSSPEEDLHHAAPMSSGPYGAAYIPVDVAKKISTGLLHICSSVVSSGVDAVASRVHAKTTAVTTAAHDAVTSSRDTLASYGFTYDWLTELTSTSSSAAVTCTEPSSSGTESWQDREAHADFAGYPSWPVPGMVPELPVNSDNTQPNDSTVAESVGVSSQPPTCLTSSTSWPPEHSPGRVKKLEDGITKGDSTYWRVKSPLITKIPCGGGLQLEISPWMWRHQPVLNYHLSSNPEACRRLFEMGMVDAAEHHFELMKFFSPDDFVTLMK
mmetsp:Transcript_7567/g.12724  ORF Transcript_7567/g.12724 Transcript_7567/m.12724 type:complete len:509 (+) Transcript_7567:68-1594(+)|eukprot:CAMPEP_0114414532 /NCGR_PEP_ID=MMETSP0103-20121206/1437_1 /TAXON_ID=37642 ORGANISM="Paraphysomonas imperforata, Strain PA2" /NCGR_SAMPLE_ID=MMETSP0103 /ASSEMBLY_ACC=CAM_ASM_000201 /LENGTH=508 /DNA_ID=CAMNT_0001582677 /DNA_START=24 /DNA_END=1550 /DNA_ORIENTATION=-